jgi:DNA-binding NtrC family response regulator/tetratricopeptide (TPR) repeat protein
MASRIITGNNRLEEAVASGQAAFEDGRFEEAASHFRAALRAGARSSDEEALIRCRLSEALEKRSLHSEQMEPVSKYEKQADFARLSEPAQMQVLTRLGWAYSFNHDIPRAVALFNQAMQVARKLDDPAGLGACYFGLGRAYRVVSEIRIARDHYTSALEYFRRVGNWRNLAESYFSIGNIDGREGDFRNALNAIKQALAIVGDRNEHELLGRAYNDLALIYDNLEAPKERIISSHEKAIEHFRMAGNTSFLAFNYNNFAMKLIWLGEWQRAEPLARQAIEEMKRIEGLGVERFMHAQAAALDTLALLYLLQGRLEEADRLLEESLEIFQGLKIKRDALRKEHPNEAETHTSIGRSYLAKRNPEEAVKHLERALDICVRLGDRQFLCDARLWLAEALLESGQVERARVQIESTREFLHELPDLLAWGLLMRQVAKLEAADGHIASAVQSLGQSTSVYQMKCCPHDLAINRVVLAQLMERQQQVDGAIAEVEAALREFERLGARLDAENAALYLESLKRSPASRSLSGPGVAGRRAGIDLASTLDGFIAKRVVQASLSRELLLQELVSITGERSQARGAIVAEVGDESFIPKSALDLRVAASVGLAESEQAMKLELLSRLPEEEYGRNFVYRLTDHQGLSYLLHIAEPRAERFLTGTVNVEPLLYVVEQSLEVYALKSRNRRTQVFDPARQLSQVEMPGFICASRAMGHVLEQIHKIRSSDVTVLITGESGTGKELIAQAVHAGSSRRANVFLPFNCSAAPRDMIESQLFGYRKGAFTGAVADNTGIIRGAERGTLFLDEIGDLPLELQPKLLRFLQESEIHPLGDSQPLRVDVRVVAATNSDLERAVAEGRFREDLFHRLNVIRIQVPPLRQRREEIPPLINHYITRYQQDSAKTEIKISEEAVDLMVVYDWPGNVRQLCNEIRRVVAYSESGEIITPDDLSAEIVQASRHADPVAATAGRGQAPPPPPGTTLSEAMEELERQMIQEALRRSAGNIARAAKELGLSRKGLYLKMDRLNFNA